MSLTIKPTRYAHPEGHTGVCYYTGDEGGLVTCGADGDVRYWLNLMDDDPSSSCIGEQATAVVSKNGKLYAGNDNNTVQILTFPDLEKAGVLTRFSTAVTAMATAEGSKFIVSGSCDMRIHVTNIETLANTELNGHEASILGLSLDPKDEYVASSSADGSIKIWRIKEKKAIHTWNNVVPKCNGFFTAKTYSTPSFHPKDGSTLAYPHGKEIVIVDRDTWKDRTRLKCSELRTDLSICKYSECGTRMASTSLYGEIVVWNVTSGQLIGYVEHQQNPKIMSLAWHLKKPNELAFCDSLGQLGCVDVIGSDETLNEAVANIADDREIDEDIKIGDENISDGETNFVRGDDDDDDDDDGENVISLNKIKKSIISGDDDAKSHASDLDLLTAKSMKNVQLEINLQAPFQPGSSPIHLLSRFMVWNDTGIVKCYTSEDNDESSIDVEFHDTTIHHSMHISNYLGHTMAALSPEILALACPPGDGARSKLVVVSLQGWGSGNKEWSKELPEGENAMCLAAGDKFVAVATSRRNLRLFMMSGLQREILGIPGTPVAMNAFKHYLVVAYHTGSGVSGDQKMDLMWIRFSGTDLITRTLVVPLAPGARLSWLGLTELASPVVVDDQGLMRIYDRKYFAWRVVCDTDQQCKGKMDHYFMIGVSEKERTIRCVLCKGCRYPATSPRPILSEIPMTLPLCEDDNETVAKEALLWQIGCHPHEQNEAVLSLIAMACRSNLDYRVVDICKEIASEKVLELAIKYAARVNRVALANKLETIADKKEQEETETNEVKEEDVGFLNCTDEVNPINTQEDLMLTPKIKSSTVVEIKPMTFSAKRSNPFRRIVSTPSPRGLSSMNTIQEKPQPKPKPTSVVAKPAQRKASAKKDEHFIAWLEKNKSDLKKEFPDLGSLDFSKAALTRYKEETEINGGNLDEDRKRKLSSPESQESEPKRSASNKLSKFLFNKS